MPDKDYMKIAIDISAKAKYPYGAIIVKDGIIVGRSDADTIGSRSMYSHAELVAIEDASKGNLYGGLKGATLYVSCEPCLMCMGAISYEEISKVFYATTLKDSSDYVIKENTAVSAEDIAEFVKLNIQVIPEFEREAALKVLKEWNEKNN